MTKRPSWLEFAHTTKPDIWLLERILNSENCNHYDRNQIKTIRLKYQALITEPTIIEKTMSEAQLFESNSPFWATDLTVAQIHNVLEAHEELSQQGYSDFMEYLLTIVRESNYDANYIGHEESALTCYYKLFNFLY